MAQNAQNTNTIAVLRQLHRACLFVLSYVKIDFNTDFTIVDRHYNFLLSNSHCVLFGT